MLYECLIVGLGGFIGSVFRYLMGLIPINETGAFPFNTFFINVIGALVISFFAFYITKENPIDSNLILFIKVGICGGFTTFSTFALETGDLIKNGNTTIALIYALLSVIVCVFVMFLPDLLLE